MYRTDEHFSLPKCGLKKDVNNCENLPFNDFHFLLKKHLSPHSNLTDSLLFIYQLKCCRLYRYPVESITCYPRCLDKYAKVSNGNQLRTGQEPWTYANSNMLCIVLYA